MDSIQKILRSMRRKEQIAVLLVMEQVKIDHTKIPGIQALQGMKGWYRIRVGNYRVIVVVDDNGRADIRRVTRRNEGMYKRLG